jgi:CyaY protein
MLTHTQGIADVMNDSEFDKMATDTLLSIEQAIDGSGAEIDLEAAGGVLTLEFENGSKIIINKQGAARQIWVAAKSGGFHYGYVESKWINEQTGGELMSDLSCLIQEQSGEEVLLG